MKYKMGILTIFILVYFLSRIPIYRAGLDGQDGNGPDMYIFLKSPPKPDYLLIARLDGKNIMVPASGHPGPMYEMFALSGRVLQVVLPKEIFIQNNIITTIKIFSSIFQLLIFMGIFLLIKKNNIFLTVILFVLSISPFALYNSSELQMDSSFGLIMTGFFALSLWVKNLPLIFLSSVFIGLGKNEWSLLLFISVLFAFVFSRNKIIDYKTCLSILLGCFAGNVVSYLFEPSLYLSGWNLLLGMSQHNTVFSKGLSQFVDMNILRSPYTNLCLFLISYCLYYVYKNFKSVSFPIILSFIYGALLFFSFFLATWGWSSRYFAPAFSVLLVTSVAIFLVDKKTNLFLKVHPVAFVTVILYLLLQTVWFCKVFKGRFDYGKRDLVKVIQSVNRCVPILPTEEVLVDKNIDFINTHAGIQGSQELAKSYGKRLCPTN